MHTFTKSELFLLQTGRNLELHDYYVEVVQDCILVYLLLSYG